MEPGSSEPGDAQPFKPTRKTSTCLQWSQVLANPETNVAWVVLTIVRFPSMEPGSSEPGDLAGLRVGVPNVDPSMEPGSSEPGDLPDRHTANAAQLSLQWSQVLANPETSPCLDEFFPPYRTLQWSQVLANPETERFEVFWQMYPRTFNGARF